MIKSDLLTSNPLKEKKWIQHGGPFGYLSSSSSSSGSDSSSSSLSSSSSDTSNSETEDNQLSKRKKITQSNSSSWCLSKLLTSWRYHIFRWYAFNSTDVVNGKDYTHFSGIWWYCSSGYRYDIFRNIHSTDIKTYWKKQCSCNCIFFHIKGHSGVIVKLLLWLYPAGDHCALWGGGMFAATNKLLFFA